MNVRFRQRLTIAALVLLIAVAVVAALVGPLTPQGFDPGRTAELAESAQSAQPSRSTT